MEFQQIKNFTLLAIKASIKAGDDILEVYNTSFNVEEKEDKSPLTLADKKANDTIVSFLKETQLPILSEEGKEIPYNERKDWEYYWVVDPLDGTKEFIKRNGEFTVNIALMHHEFPVAGIIFVPVKNQLYFGIAKLGSYFFSEPTSQNTLENLIEKSTKLPRKTGNANTFKIVGSRSHMSAETELFIEEQKLRHPSIEMVSMGSSLKICLVAEGLADVYPRFAPTMEWDTAAGQAIAEAAQKSVLNHQTGQRLSYNKPNLVNPWFIVQ